MFEYVSAVCTVIVSLQVLKVICGFVYSQFVAPALNAGPDLKKMGKWAGNDTHIQTFSGVRVCTFESFSWAEIDTFCLLSISSVPKTMSRRCLGGRIGGSKDYFFLNAQCYEENLM